MPLPDVLTDKDFEVKWDDNNTLLHREIEKRYNDHPKLLARVLFLESQYDVLTERLHAADVIMDTMAANKPTIEFRQYVNMLQNDIKLLKEGIKKYVKDPRSHYIPATFFEDLILQTHSKL